MRTRIESGKLVATAMLALVLPFLPVWAGDEEENPGCPPIAGIIEGPDPIPSSCFDEFVDASEESDAVLSPDGDQVVAWADPVGEDHDIAIREWTGEEWKATRYLTSDFADEREPDLYLDVDGALYLAWTRYGDTPQVRFTHRDPVSGAWSADVVVADQARRPAIVTWNGRVVLAFERYDGVRASELVVALERVDGSFELRVVARGRGTESLSPTLRSDAWGLWIRWRAGNGYTALRHIDSEGRLGSSTLLMPERRVGSANRRTDRAD